MDKRDVPWNKLEMWPESSYDIVHNKVSEYIELLQMDMNTWLKSEEKAGSHNQWDDFIEEIIMKATIKFLKANNHSIALMAHAIIELGPDKRPRQ